MDYSVNNLVQLAQVTPSDTNNALLISPNDFEKIVVTLIVVTNTDSSPHDFRIFHDDDGTTYSTATALYYDEALSANTTLNIDYRKNGIPVSDSGTMAVRTDSASNITFTAYGFVIPGRHA